jgi:voltage-gated potassium channel
VNQLRYNLAQVLESSGEGLRVGRIIDVLLILLIVGNVIAIVLESVEEIASAHRQLFIAIEVISVGIFTIEYLLRF